MRPPYIRRKLRSPFDKAALGVLVRRAERGVQQLNVTEYRLTLLRAIERKEIKAGRGSFDGHWRWHGSTVTAACLEMLHARWVEPVGAHLELTDAGRDVLAKAAS
jgi:hypothetical protein